MEAICRGWRNLEYVLLSTFMIERKNCKFWKLSDKVSGELYDVFEGAPCKWSEKLGATHTLLHDVGALPCKLKKGFMYIGRGTEGEDEGLRWDKERVSVLFEDTACIVIDRGPGRNRFKLGREWEGIGVFDMEIEVEVELEDWEE